MKHKTQSQRLSRKLKELRRTARQLMHAPLATQDVVYVRVVQGHYAYYGRPHNYPVLSTFRQEVRRIW